MTVASVIWENQFAIRNTTQGDANFNNDTSPLNTYSFNHQFQGPLCLPYQAHAMMNTAWTQATLKTLKKHQLKTNSRQVASNKKAK